MQKIIHIPELECDIVIARRRGARSIRIALRGNGTVRLSVPFGVSETAAMRFLLSKKEWILSHKKTAHVLSDGILVGKSHRLHFVDSAIITSPKAKTLAQVITITKPTGLPENDPLVQEVAKKAAEKALKKDALHLLPQRMATLAAKYNLKYHSVGVKRLKSRWGSCSNFGDILLTTYLIQLPWKLIDYVIIHELCHVIHHNHSPQFWATVEQYIPNYKLIKKELKALPTDVIPSEMFY